MAEWAPQAAPENDGTKTSRRWWMSFLTTLVPLLIAGYFVSNTNASCSTIAILTTLAAPHFVQHQTDQWHQLLLWYAFYKPVYYHDERAPFPSGSKEWQGYWVGVNEHVGSSMTFKILMEDTQEVIYHSDICSAADPASKNKDDDPLNADICQVTKSAIEQGVGDNHSQSPYHGEEVAKSDAESNATDNHGEHNHGEDIQVKTVSPDEDTPTETKPLSQMHIVNPQDLVGCTFLLDEQEDGQWFCRFWAKIVEYVAEHDEKNKMLLVHWLSKGWPVQGHHYIRWAHGLYLKRMPRMMQHCGISSESLATKDLYSQATLIMHVQSTMCRSNGRMGRLHTNPLMWLQWTTLSHVQSMQETTTSLTNRDGNASRD